MATAPLNNRFDAWLSEKLLSFNPDTDLDIFVSYITGILETETVEDEKINSLSELLSELLVDHTSDAVKLRASQKAEKDVLKDVIIAQYSHISDGEESDEDSTETGNNALASKQSPNKHTSSTASTTAHNQDDLLTRNVNSVLVKERERQARDQAKLDSEMKKQKDKEDREKQKQKATDRKENEKKRTQKGEKKR
ncbi:hypothetical protein HELRODRAFT_163408 [Helobdella robusta]|uniref:Coiled-coil domain-containing protein 43 n=1 Tax=Helobdella robusta TaxID=6412 RepID=T1EU04_HELRO|nr:hypothetical protein HELRODRAFT_163408 [Helobdella robusta]ESN96354.1 hypothetical protein HELRODRAFT_163408 [Helobdella robusta]